MSDADPSDPRGLIPYIRDTAVKYGIDPDVAVNVARSEGLRNPIGDNGRSFGAFQLYTGGGLGNEFQKAGGDIGDEKATIDYALQRASQGGWGPWHGAKNTGIGEWDGIRVPGSAQVNVPVPFTGNESPTFNVPGAPVQSQDQNKQQLPGVASAGAGSGSLYPQFPQAPNVGFLQLPQLPQRRPLNLSNIQALLPSPLPTLQSLLQRG